MAGEMMRAALAEAPGGPEVLVVREVPRISPGPGEVLIRVACCGLNPLDVMARRGGAAWMVRSWPLTPGVECSGRVAAVGEGVEPAWIGRRVVTRSHFGGNAEFTAVPVSNVAELPEQLGWAAAAAFRGASHTAWHLLHTIAHVLPGQTLLVHSAAGAVGLMLTQLAKAAGLTVVGLVGSSQKAEAAAPFGADHLLDYTSNDWPERVNEVCGGHGVDLIVDGNGGPSSSDNLGLLAPFGRLVLIGATSGERPALMQAATLIPICGSVSGFSLELAEKHADSEGAISRSIADMVVTGTLRVPVSATVSLDEISEAHRRFERREVFGRLVIVVEEDL